MGLVYEGKYFACLVGDKETLRITYVIGRLVKVRCESHNVWVECLQAEKFKQKSMFASLTSLK